MTKNKQINYLILILLLTLGTFGYFYFKNNQIPKEKISESEKDKLINQQIELAEFKKNIKPLTEEEKQMQLKELAEFKKNIKPLTEEEKQMQLKELEDFKIN